MELYFYGITSCVCMGELCVGEVGAGEFFRLLSDQTDTDQAEIMESDECADHMPLPRFVCNALYVTDLDPNFVSDDILLHLFGQVGNVLSVKLCPNAKSAGDLSHAYINYSTTEEACDAWQRLNYKQLNGIPMRILFSNLDPTSRYNQNANLIIWNLEESIDSEALHHTFSLIGVVISCKVKLDSNGKSLGHGFIQFQDEEDAQRAIKLVNGKMLHGKQVYVGPFIPRSRDSTLESTMNLNPQDLNPAHTNTVQPVGASLSSSSSDSNVGDEDEVESGSSDDEPSSQENEEDDLVAFKARAAEMIQRARDAIIAEKRASIPHIDPCYVPSSEPWAPQPWSVETLRANLALAHLPEERRAMLGGTLLPLVWTCTKEYASIVTDELVKSMDIEEIAHLMKSTKALQRKVEATTKMILKRIRDQPPFVPKSASASATPQLTPATPKRTPPTPKRAPATPKLADHKAPNVDPTTVAMLPGLQVGTRVFQFPEGSNFRKGTGFFDVSWKLESAVPYP